MNTTVRSCVICLPVALAVSFAGCEQLTPGATDLAGPLAPSPEAAAKTDKSLRILSGRVSFAESRLSIELKGTAGFRLTGALSLYDGVFVPWTTAFRAEGEDVDLAARWYGTAFLGTTAVLRGQTYERVGHQGPTDPSAFVTFEGRLERMPPVIDNGMVELSAPFTFLGGFGYMDGQRMVTEDLIGQGVATLNYREQFGLWHLEGAVYEFLPH